MPRSKACAVGSGLQRLLPVNQHGVEDGCRPEAVGREGQPSGATVSPSPATD